jgi:hypothetical protein
MGTGQESEMKQKDNEIKLEIQIDEQVACGQYINMAVVNHTDSEFVIDCIYVQPQVPVAKVRSRLITSPRHAKRLLRALQKNLDIYEKNHGVIELAEGKQFSVQGLPIQ